VGDAQTRVIEFQEVTQHYSLRQRGIAGLSFTSSSVGVTAVIGPSGSGKSTLLRLVAGLEGLSSGVILLDGQPIHQQSPADRHISLLPQAMVLLSHLTARENLLLPIRLRGDRFNEKQAARLQHWVSAMKLDELLGRYPAELSAGQQQRVALARAMMSEPRAILLDEPFSHLDVPLRRELRQVVKETIVHSPDSPLPAILWATHDPEDVVALADRVIVLDQGRMVQIGAPSELISSPANDWLAAMMSPAVGIHTFT
jgi:ABC-type Fe3+/spermidine/putrescine transport system ATPase subunit